MHRDTKPVETGALSRAPIRSAARSIPITSVLAQQRRRIDHVRPVARRTATDPGRGRGGRHVAAPAGAAHHLVFGHCQRGRRDIEDLHAGGDPAGSVGQARPAPPARQRFDDPGLIRLSDPRQARARMAFLPAL